MTIPNSHVWDGVFNVVSKQYSEDNHIKINCGTKNNKGKKYSCVECPTKCYHNNVNVIVFEHVK
jgi:hypothetical protein